MTGFETDLENKTLERNDKMAHCTGTGSTETGERNTHCGFNSRGKGETQSQTFDIFRLGKLLGTGTLIRVPLPVVAGACTAVGATPRALVARLGRRAPAAGTLRGVDTGRATFVAHLLAASGDDRAALVARVPALHGTEGTPSHRAGRGAIHAALVRLVPSAAPAAVGLRRARSTVVLQVAVLALVGQPSPRLVSGRRPGRAWAVTLGGAVGRSRVATPRGVAPATVAAGGRSAVAASALVVTVIHRTGRRVPAPLAGRTVGAEGLAHVSRHAGTSNGTEVTPAAVLVGAGFTAGLAAAVPALRGRMRHLVRGAVVLDVGTLDAHLASVAVSTPGVCRAASAVHVVGSAVGSPRVGGGSWRGGRARGPLPGGAGAIVGTVVVP